MDITHNEPVWVRFPRSRLWGKDWELYVLLRGKQMGLEGSRTEREGNHKGTF